MSALVLCLLLAGGPVEETAPLSDPAKVPTAQELRESVRGALRYAARSDVSITSAVYRLCEAANDLAADKELSPNERTELTHVVRNRLIALGDKIAAQWHRDQAEKAKAERLARAARRASKRPEGSLSDLPLASPDPAPAEGAFGGRVEEDNAEDLIELIRTTIAPETWDVAGGPGSIYYYKNFKALVIRQTAEVHWLIGGLRKQLEK